VVLAFPSELVVANLGDSRLFGVGGEGEAAGLTLVHNLGNQQ
jgi:serine/threonine protein phosphatase PrpC